MNGFHATRVMVLLSAGLVGTIAAAQAAPATYAPAPLAVGSPAPKLDLQEFVKGEPVKEFAPGKVYVVEFWATWDRNHSVPMIPRLTDLQKRYKDVVVLGVSMDRDADTVRRFVEKQGPAMNYRVAVEAHFGSEGKMAKAWRSGAFPYAVIVDGQGKVAWAGVISSRPPLDKLSDLEAALQKVAGKPQMVARAAAVTAPVAPPPVAAAPKMQPVQPPAAKAPVALAAPTAPAVPAAPKSSPAPAVAPSAPAVATAPAVRTPPVAPPPSSAAPQTACANAPAACQGRYGYARRRWLWIRPAWRRGCEASP
jgi:hypothetical protein